MAVALPEKHGSVLAIGSRWAALRLKRAYIGVFVDEGVHRWMRLKAE